MVLSDARLLPKPRKSRGDGAAGDTGRARVVVAGAQAHVAACVCVVRVGPTGGRVRGLEDQRWAEYSALAGRLRTNLSYHACSLAGDPVSGRFGAQLEGGVGK